MATIVDKHNVKPSGNT